MDPRGKIGLARARPEPEVEKPIRTEPDKSQPDNITTLSDCQNHRHIKYKSVVKTFSGLDPLETPMKPLPLFNEHNLILL